VQQQQHHDHHDERNLVGGSLSCWSALGKRPQHHRLAAISLNCWWTTGLGLQRAGWPAAAAHQGLPACIT
jgi:hypothetical protein